jgi:1,4-dihydroxy-2-naphthoate octaprenyltransferase
MAIRRRFSEWNETAKTWPLSASAVAIAVSLSFIFWKGYSITWLYALIGLPLLCLAMTGAIYRFMFPAFKRNNVSNVLVHLLWTGIIAIATSLICCHEIHWNVLSAILPVGLIASGITHGKNKIAAQSYAFEIMTTYLYLAVCSIIGIFPIATVIVFMTIPIALGCSKTIMNSIEGGAHLTKDLGARTANLLHLFSGLLAVAFAVARFI